MSSQLDILALEPFYGGVRRAMLETVVRCSRHRWTVLKLPPRRIERRLSAAAHWFAEQLSRHWVGKLDLLFTSEALNLADLNRLMPQLAKKPSVVYFHSKQLPDADQPNPTGAHDIVNLSTATAATELWFNSRFHNQLFLRRAAALVGRHRELSSRNPMPELTAKSRLMHPPIDLNQIAHVRAANAIQRRDGVIFVDTRDADMKLLKSGLATLQTRGEVFELITVGPTESLPADIPRRTIPESDEAGQVAGMLEANFYLSTRFDAEMDNYAIRAMAARCWPIVPNAACYDELIPRKLRESCMYDGTADDMSSRIQDAWHLEPPENAHDQLLANLKSFDAIAACKAMDERLSELAAAFPTAGNQPMGTTHPGGGNSGATHPGGTQSSGMMTP